MRVLIRILATCFLLVAGAVPAQAQFGESKEKPKGSATGVKFGKQATQRWRVGVKVQAVGGPCVGIFATVPVPTDWPEQSVKVVKEELSPQIGRVNFRVLENGVKQMLIEIPQISGGETAQALITFEVTRSTILPPDDPSVFKIPDRLPRDISKFLGPSPMIETRHPQIQKVAKEVVEGKDGAWEKVEAIYDWVRENVEYKNGSLKGALAALRDKTGDCEELTSLFVALCRDNRIPARTVWIPDHCYPEFYLVDNKGQGHWIPCQVAGTHDFGGMPEFRPVLQKGDNFKVPEKKDPQRYVSEHLTGKPAPGGGKPQVEFVRDLLPAN